MKHVSPQFDLPGQEQVFNLAGETVQILERFPIELYCLKPDYDTRDMFLMPPKLEPKTKRACD